MNYFKILLFLILCSNTIFSQDNGSLLIISQGNLRVYLNDEFKGYTDEKLEGIFIDNLSPNNYELKLKGKLLSKGVYKKLITIESNRTLEVNLTEITANNLDSQTRIEGFRTDGYYITMEPLIYKGRKNLGYPLESVQANTKEYLLFLAFRILPELYDSIPSKFLDKKYHTNPNHAHKVKSYLLLDTKRNIKKVKKINPEYYNDKKFINEFLSYDKIIRGFKDYDIYMKSQKNTPIEKFLLTGYCEPWIYLDENTTIPVFIGNFSGLSEDAVSADFLVFKEPNFAHSSEPWYLEIGKYSFNYYKPTDGIENKSRILQKDIRLMFVEDKK